MTLNESNVQENLSDGNPVVPQYRDTDYTFPELITLGTAQNTFRIAICELPTGVDMTIDRDTATLQISDKLTQAQQSLLLIRFILNLTYRVGKSAGAVKGQLEDSDIDGMAVGVWQWLATSNLLSFCSPAQLVEWMATKRMEIDAARNSQSL